MASASPRLRNCPYCNTEPVVERGWDWMDLSYAYIRIKCNKCNHSSYWVKYTPKDDASYQHAISQASGWWNTKQMSDMSEDE